MSKVITVHSSLFLLLFFKLQNRISLHNLIATALIVLGLFKHNTNITKPASTHRQLHQVRSSEQQPFSLHSCMTPTYSMTESTSRRGYGGS